MMASTSQLLSIASPTPGGSHGDTGSLAQGGGICASGSGAVKEGARLAGGDIGWVDRGTLPPSLREALGTLGTGQISAPLETGSRVSL